MDAQDKSAPTESTLQERAAHILSKPMYPPFRGGGHHWYSTNLTWGEQDKENLRILCEAGASLEKSADALGRSTSSIAWRASDEKWALPVEWRHAIGRKGPRRVWSVPEARYIEIDQFPAVSFPSAGYLAKRPPSQKKVVKLKAPPRIALAYPFVVKRRNEHADLLAVNALVPRSMPGREDVRQEVMLALWEGTVTLEQLRAPGALRAFTSAFRRRNDEDSGYAVSLDMPMRAGCSWHDVLEARPQ